MAVDDLVHTLMKATITEINAARGMFIVELSEGGHAAFTLFSHAVLKLGDEVEGADIGKGARGWLMPSSRQRFEVRADTGPSTLQACRAAVWP